MHAVIDPKDTRCRHLRINGARCTCPALKNREFCFEHQYRKTRKTRGLKASLPESFATAPLVAFAWAEDHASILHNINIIVEALARSVIDLRQAATLNSLQRTALKTLRQMHDLESLHAKESREEPVQDFVLDECDLPIAVSDCAAPAPGLPGHGETESPVLPPVPREDLVSPDRNHDPEAPRLHGPEPGPIEAPPSDPNVDPSPGLTFTAAADPTAPLPAPSDRLLTPLLSTDAPTMEVTGPDSTLTSAVENNSPVSHTCALKRKNRFPRSPSGSEPGLSERSASKASRS